MNDKVHWFTNHRSMRPQVGASVVLLATILIACASGCSSPKPGPTDPKEFIVQRRSWATSHETPTRPDATAPATTEPATVPVAP